MVHFICLHIRQVCLKNRRRIPLFKITQHEWKNLPNFAVFTNGVDHWKIKWLFTLHSSSSRGGSSFVSSVFHHHPGSGAHTHDRNWPSLAYYRQQHRFNQQRFNRPGVPAPIVPGIRGVAPMNPAVPQPDQTGGFYVYPRSSSSGQNVPEAESSYPNNYIALERERLSHFRTVSRVAGWGAYHPTSGSGSGSGNRSGTDHR